MTPFELAAGFDPMTGAMIFRRECSCGLRSTWRDTPEEAEADKPATCAAHDAEEAL